MYSVFFLPLYINTIFIIDNIITIVYTNISNSFLLSPINSSTANIISISSIINIVIISLLNIYLFIFVYVSLLL